MTTARELAREAGLAADINMITYPTKSVENIADAASDVWEPAYNDLLGRVQYLINWANSKGLLEDGGFCFPDGDTWQADQ